MKKELKKALKPQKPFEEWTKEYDVEINQKTITKRQYFSKWIQNRKVIAGLSSVMACLILFAVILPVVLSNSENPPAYKIYTAQNSESERINIEELYKVEDVLLFDKDNIIDHKLVNKDVATDDKELVLSYVMQECFLVATDGVNGFYVEYRIRLYKHYEFVGHLNYSELPLSFSVGDIKISYVIWEAITGDLSYLYFAYNNAEYFLEVKGFEDVTEISEDTLKILLTDLLSA